MHTPTLYVNMLGTVNNVIKQKTEGLTHADSMLQLPIPANCMNWILGHIMVYRMQYLGVIDGVSKPDEGEFALYGFGSEPLTIPTKPSRSKPCWRGSMICPRRLSPHSKKCRNPAWMKCGMKSGTSPWISSCTSIWSSTRRSTSAS